MPTTGDTSPTSGSANAPLVRIHVGILSDGLVGILNAGQQADLEQRVNVSIRDGSEALAEHGAQAVADRLPPP